MYSAVLSIDIRTFTGLCETAEFGYYNNNNNNNNNERTFGSYLVRAD